MVKCETLGMLEVAKVNPVITSEDDVANYSFITYDDDLYLIANTLVGDDTYKEDVVISAGNYLNGFLVKAWEGQKLVIDGKHITGGISDISVGDALVAQDDGTLASGEASGVHLVVTDIGVTLTEAAIKAKVVVL